MLDQQNPPKYTYSTVHVPRGGGGAPRVQKAPNFGQAAHWGIGALNWAANKYKVSKAMEKLAPTIDAQMSTDGGVLVCINYRRAPKISGNDDKPIFVNAYVAGNGCSMTNVVAEWNVRQAGPQIRPYFGPGWTWESRLIWITMDD